MNSDTLAARLRPFETASDRRAPPGLLLVSRLDARGRARRAAADPEGNRAAMVATATHLLGCGFAVAYAYTQGDEVSLLFHQGEGAFGRTHRKWISILAGEASASLSLRLGEPVAFDCRLVELPSAELVIDYFTWRQEVAAQVALAAACVQALRGGGVDEDEAGRRVAGLSRRDRHEVLHGYGLNFNDLPAWRRRGIGLWWADPPEGARGPRRTIVDDALPRGELHLALLRDRLRDAGA